MDILAFDGPLQRGSSLLELLVARFDSICYHGQPAYERGFTLPFYDEDD